MRPLLIDLLHIYVILMIGAFIIMSAFAATGTFDTWGRRYIRNRRGRKIVNQG